MKRPYPPFFKFLGTGGGRHVMALQIRSTAEFLIGYENTLLHIDPGPGALVYLRKMKPPVHPSQLHAILVSHRHIDHSSDVSALAEAMTDTGKTRDKWVFLPGDAFEPHSVLYPHILSLFDHKPIRVTPHGEWTVGDIHIRSSCQHLHPVETYGFHFILGSIHVAYIADTAFFEDLISEYRDAHIVIINVTLHQPIRGVQHLTVRNALELLMNIRPEVAFFTHFGPHVLKLEPWRYAQEWSQQAGCRIIPAQDGRYFELDRILE